MEKLNLIFKINPNYFNDIFEFCENKKIKFLISFYNKRLQKKLQLKRDDFIKEHIKFCCHSYKNVFDYKSFLHTINEKNNFRNDMIKSIFDKEIYEKISVNFDNFTKFISTISENIEKILNKIIYNFDLCYKTKLNFKLLEPIPIDYKNIRCLTMNPKKKQSFEWKEFEKFIKWSKLFNNLIKLKLFHSYPENLDLINQMKNLKFLSLRKILKTKNNLILNLKGLEELELKECVLELAPDIFLSLKSLSIFEGSYILNYFELPNAQFIIIKKATFHFKKESKLSKKDILNSFIKFGYYFNNININKKLEIDELYYNKNNAKFLIDPNKESNYILCFHEDRTNESVPLLNEYYNEKSEMDKDVDLYVNNKKINFSFNYKFNNNKLEQLVKIDCKKVITDLSYLFYNCYSLTFLNFCSFNSNQITDIKHIFHNCTSLTSLNLSNFNTEKITDMSYMFSYCTSLTSLNLSNFKIINVKNMSNMFYYCSSLEYLDLSYFNMNKVTDMSYMFSYCSSLKYLILPNLNTDCVKNMSNMFYYCSSLLSLNLSNFNTNNVTDMSYMFSYCFTLTNLNLSNFNTDNVIDMSNMFNNCRSLNSLNLSNFNIINSNISKMFFNCFSLKYLKISESTNHIDNINDYFNLNSECNVSF